MIRRRLAGLAVVAAALLLIFPLTSAEAAEHDLEFANTGGSFNLSGFDPLDLPAGQAGLTGTWDDTTGDFEGVTTINPFSLEVLVPIVLSIEPNLNPDGVNVTGTIDPATGEAALTASVILTIEVPSLSAVCSTPAFDIEFTTGPPDGAPLEPIPFDPDADYTMTLVSETFTVPQVALSETCAIADVVNQNAGFPADGTATLALQRGTPAPPTTPTTQETTTTAGPGGDGAGAGAGQAARPRFTG